MTAPAFLPAAVRAVPRSTGASSRRVVLGAVLVGAAAAVVGPTLRPARVGAQEATPVTVALDWYPNANHAGLFLAEARGAFAAEGLAVDPYTPADPTTVLQTVGAGRDTFGISYQTDVLLARAEGVPVVSIAALTQRPLLGIMVLADAGIARPRDLVGKTVGFPGIPSQEAYLRTMLEGDGATLADVELVDIGFDLTPALVAGRVDASLGAFWTHETIVAKREGFDVDLLRVDDWGVPPYYELVLVTAEATLNDQPELVARFLRAVRLGYEAAIDDQAAALDALAAAAPDLDRAVEQEGLALLIPVWTDGVTTFGEQDPERWRAYAAWMAEQGLIPADLNPEAAFAVVPAPAGVATPSA